MKAIKILLCTYMLLVFNVLNAQEKNDSIYVTEDNFGFSIVLNSMNSIDTLVQAPFNIEILDYMILNDTVAVLYEAPIHFAYDKFVQTDGEWKYERTSGIFPKSTEYEVYMLKLPQNHSFKIIEIDLVSYKYGDIEVIKDCKEFEEEYNAKKRKYEEYLKNKKNN